MIARNWALSVCAMTLLSAAAVAADKPTSRPYQNRLTRIADPKPLLADYPEFFAPVKETVRYEAPILVDDPGADLDVRAWRFSYNARAIIEMPNRLRADNTALIVVHPWGIDDGQGWRTPEPAGVADFCTPTKNDLSHEHVIKVLNPFLKRLRGKVRFLMYSQPGSEDPIRKKIYRSFRGKPSDAERKQGHEELAEKLNGFTYRGGSIPAELSLSTGTPVVDYFKQFPGIDAGDRFNPKGFWELPIPVVKSIEVDPDDVMIYDAEGYPALKQFLQSNGIRHILLAGYCTDMCYKATTAGYANLSPDFNVFLVADATLATFPANDTPRYATNAAISYAALDHLVTQVSWIKHSPRE